MGAQRCRICASPHRREIEELSKDIPISELARKYSTVFGVDVKALDPSIRRHLKGKHKISKMMEVIMHPSTPTDKTPNLEGFVQSLLEIANVNVLEDPSKVKIRDALMGQKLLIEKQKVKIGETALMMSMAKLFGGFPDAPALKGEEVVDGLIQPNQE